MNYQAIWTNFQSYLSSFTPLSEHKEKFLAYFGNDEQTGFRNRALALYNPVSNRRNFNCGYRLCINVYQNCNFGCRYCYVNAYSKGVGQGKRNSGLVNRLKRDIGDFQRLNLPAGPVHISNSTDSLQDPLESQYWDTHQTLEILAANKELFSEVIILTKNPGQLLAGPGLSGQPDYLGLLSSLRDRLRIEVTVAFFRDNYKKIEPGTPHPKERLDAMNRLAEMGFTTRLRLDPLFPGDWLQTKDDIIKILDHASGIQCVISKPLRLVRPPTGTDTSFFELMWPFYEGGKKHGVEWHGKRWVFSEQRAREEMVFLREECERRRLPLLHCKETVLVDDQGIPLIESKLGPASTSRFFDA